MVSGFGGVVWFHSEVSAMALDMAVVKGPTPLKKNTWGVPFSWGVVSWALNLDDQLT